MRTESRSATSLTVERLLEPFSFSDFHDAYYEKQPLLIKRQSPAFYDDLLTLQALNEHLGEVHLSSRALRLLRNGETLDSSKYTYARSSSNSRYGSGAVDKDAVFARFYEGYTINLIEYERNSTAMLRFRHDVERMFHAPALANIYLTPRNAQGLVPHWDTHDTFILQFAGVKEWTIYDSPIALPASRQLPREGKWTLSEPTLKATLEPGDLLYLPRGFVHEARSGDAVSGHVTIGLFVFTYADLLRQIADNADVDPWLRKALPIDYQSVASNDEFLRHVNQFFARADLPAYLERLHSDFADDRLPDATDRMTDYVRLPSLDTDSRLRTRSVVCHALSAGGEEIVLAFNRKSLRFPPAAAESIRYMIAAGEFTVSALPGDGQDNLSWCSTLVREGFLSIIAGR